MVWGTDSTRLCCVTHVCNNVFCLCSFQSCTLVMSDAECADVPRRAVATRTAIAMVTTRTWKSTTPRARAVLSDARVYGASLRYVILRHATL